METDRETAEDFELQILVVGGHRERLFLEFDAELAAISHVRNIYRGGCGCVFTRAILARGILHMRIKYVPGTDAIAQRMKNGVATIVIVIPVHSNSHRVRRVFNRGKDVVESLRRTCGKIHRILWWKGSLIPEHVHV